MSFEDLEVPAGVRAEEFILRPITVADAERDHAAVMETRDELRTWEQTDWPADDFTVEENRDDLADLESRHADGRAFTYTVVDPADSVCLGCVYLFPTTATFLAKATVTARDDLAWSDVDAVVYFWIRSSSASTGMEGRLLAALRAWLAQEWGSEHAVFVTSELFERQLRLLESADLSVRFEIVEPSKPGRYLAFG